MQKPNIVFIYIDDMGYKDIACAGSTFYETPNIDKLRKNGVQFNQAYAACPVCSPSRASVLTGRYPARLGVTDWIDMAGTWHPCKSRMIDAPYIKHLPKNEVTVAQYLKDAGYSTWHVGKWHLGGAEFYPTNFGFEKNIGGCDWGNPYNGYFSPYGIETLAEGPDGEFLSDRLTDEAITLVKNASDKPFFLNFWHYAVHTPIQAKPEDIKYFQDKAKRLGLDKQQAIVEGEFFQLEHKRGQRVSRRVIQSSPEYAALIFNLDMNIGRLISALEESDKLDNTLIVFSSDNGGLSTSETSPTCNAPASEGKGWTNEGGLRVPFVASWKGKIKPNTTCETPITTPDLFCTFLSAASVSPRNDIALDGVDILPLMQGDTISQRAIYWHYPHYGNQGGKPGAAVRLGDFKLIRYFEDNHVALYNIANDIGEQHELSAQNPELVASLNAKLDIWLNEVQALYPTENPTFIPE